ncbi:hypothetical protein WHR41_00260 [Cladosporium halotolerans]|uniref:SMP domain-containing protein n=1 Tax=Cladosporium halotolerans TaxID=1052096 RepID=A0AB34L950_9PEZI
MSDSTFHLTKEDVRKPESKASHSNSGNVPADSDAAKAQSVVDQANQNKQDVINERVAGLPKPEQPPVASDFNSANANIAAGSGAISGGQPPEPSTAHSSVRVDGNANKVNTDPHGGAREGLEGAIPNDAVARDAKDKAGLKDTTQ